MPPSGWALSALVTVPVIVPSCASAAEPNSVRTKRSARHTTTGPRGERRNIHTPNSGHSTCFVHGLGKPRGLYPLLNRHPHERRETEIVGGRQPDRREDAAGVGRSAPRPAKQAASSRQPRSAAQTTPR